MSAKINAVHAIVLNDEVKAVLETHKTKSAQIRALFALLGDRSTVANILTLHYGKEVKYQHVRNVLITPVKEA